MFFFINLLHVFGFNRELYEESSLQTEKLNEIGQIDFEFVGDPQILEVHIFTTTEFDGDPTESPGIMETL